MEALLATLLSDLASTSSRFDAIQALRNHVGDSSRIDDRTASTILDGLYLQVSRDKHLLCNGKAAQQTTAGVRLSQCSQLVHSLLQKCLDTSRGALIRRFLTHLVDVLPVRTSILLAPASSAYLRAATLLLTIDAHLQHLEQKLWASVVTLCISAVEALTTGNVRLRTEVGQSLELLCVLVGWTGPGLLSSPLKGTATFLQRLVLLCRRLVEHYDNDVALQNTVAKLLSKLAMYASTTDADASKLAAETSVQLVLSTYRQRMPRASVLPLLLVQLDALRKLNSVEAAELMTYLSDFQPSAHEYVCWRLFDQSTGDVDRLRIAASLIRSPKNDAVTAAAGLPITDTFPPWSLVAQANGSPSAGAGDVSLELFEPDRDRSAAACFYVLAQIDRGALSIDDVMQHWTELAKRLKARLLDLTTPELAVLTRLHLELRTIRDMKLCARVNATRLRVRLSSALATLPALARAVRGECKRMVLGEHLEIDSLPPLRPVPLQSKSGMELLIEKHATADASDIAQALGSVEADDLATIASFVSALPQVDICEPIVVALQSFLEARSQGHEDGDDGKLYRDILNDLSLLLPTTARALPEGWTNSPCAMHWVRFAPYRTVLAQLTQEVLPAYMLERNEHTHLMAIELLRRSLAMELDVTTANNTRKVFDWTAQLCFDANRATDKAKLALVRLLSGVPDGKLCGSASAMTMLMTRVGAERSVAVLLAAVDAILGKIESFDISGGRSIMEDLISQLRKLPADDILQRARVEALNRLRRTTPLAKTAATAELCLLGVPPEGEIDFLVIHRFSRDKPIRDFPKTISPHVERELDLARRLIIHGEELRADLVGRCHATAAIMAALVANESLEWSLDGIAQAETVRDEARSATSLEIGITECRRLALSINPVMDTRVLAYCLQSIIVRNEPRQARTKAAVLWSLAPLESLGWSSLLLAARHAGPGSGSLLLKLTRVPAFRPSLRGAFIRATLRPDIGPLIGPCDHIDAHVAALQRLCDPEPRGFGTFGATTASLQRLFDSEALDFLAITHPSVIFDAAILERLAHLVKDPTAITKRNAALACQIRARSPGPDAAVRADTWDTKLVQVLTQSYAWSGDSTTALEAIRVLSLADDLRGVPQQPDCVTQQVVRTEHQRLHQAFCKLSVSLCEEEELRRLLRAKSDIALACFPALVKEHMSEATVHQVLAEELQDVSSMSSTELDVLRKMLQLTRGATSFWLPVDLEQLAELALLHSKAEFAFFLLHWRWAIGTGTSPSLPRVTRALEDQDYYAGVQREVSISTVVDAAVASDVIALSSEAEAWRVAKALVQESLLSLVPLDPSPAAYEVDWNDHQLLPSSTTDSFEQDVWRAIARPDSKVELPWQIWQRGSPSVGQCATVTRLLGTGTVERDDLDEADLMRLVRVSKGGAFEMRSRFSSASRLIQLRQSYVRKTPAPLVRMADVQILRALGKPQEAISLLDSVLRDPEWIACVDSRQRICATVEAGLMKHDARVARPERLLQEILLPVVDQLSDVALHRRFADFCFEQHQACLKSDEFQRLDGLRAAKQAEIAEIDATIHGLPKDARVQHLLAKRLKAKTIFEREDAEVKRLLEANRVYLSQALTHYLRGAALGGDSPDRMLRCVALWLEQIDPAADKAFAAEVATVPSHRFVGLFNQLTARLSLAEDLFGRTLTALVERICLEHPHATIYTMYAMEHTMRGTDITAKERQKAAARINRRLAASPIKGLVGAVAVVCGAYCSLAAYNLGKRDGNGKLMLKSFPGHRTFDIDIPRAKVAPPSVASGGSYIVEFLPELNIAGGLSRPKIISIRLSDGRLVKELLKYSKTDDLRQDMVMEQVFGEVHALLLRDRQSRRRNLGVRRYGVVPLTEKVGVLEFLLATTPVQNVVTRLHKRFRNDTLTMEEARQKMHLAKDGSAAQRRKLYDEVCQEISPAMRFANWEEAPEVWFDRQRRFTRSNAVASIVGWVLGIGDRHLGNILIDTTSGGVVHIDFGIAFEAGRLLAVPELVPFRLTRDWVDGMGQLGVEGVFRTCAELTLGVLRENSSTVLDVLAVLKADPLYNWVISDEQLAKRTQSPRATRSAQTDVSRTFAGSGEAERAVKVVQGKLTSSLSVAAQVSDLIQQAIDPALLSQHYSGWSAFY
ncbi:Serine/threonine-protein kinase tel1 [Savitreella phatthalungensis]